MAQKTPWRARLGRIFNTEVVADPEASAARGPIPLDERMRIVALSLDVKAYVNNQTVVPFPLSMTFLRAIKKDNVTDIQIAGAVSVLRNPDSGKPQIEEVAKLLDPERLHIAQTADQTTLNIFSVDRTTAAFRANAAKAGLDEKAVRDITLAALDIRHYLDEGKKVPATADLRMAQLLRREGVRATEVYEAFRAFATKQDPKGATLKALLDPRKMHFAGTATPLATLAGATFEINAMGMARKLPKPQE